MDEILILQNIQKRFGGVHAVQDVSLSFTTGEVCALMGENGAGKSTLGKIIAGIHNPDSGDIWFNGEKLESITPFVAQEKGISLVLQELDLFPSLSVGMNIINNNISFKHLEKGFLSPKLINKAVEPWLKKVRLDINPSTLLEDLSMAQIQMVAIARILSMNTRLIIMDEPTSSLTNDGVENLFSLIDELRKDGVTIIYVSHKMSEIFRISDTVAVMRDGAFIAKKRTAETNKEEIIELMVGRPLSGKERQKSWNRNKTILDVKELTSSTVKNISFSLSEGEVLGIAGLVGAGRSELGEALFGLDPILSGSVELQGKILKNKSPRNAIANGIGFIPEDRKNQGLMMQMSVKENMIMSYLDHLQSRGFFNKEKIHNSVVDLIDQIKIKTASIDSCVEELSGGNQQKVLVSRWLMVNPPVLFLDDPTRGVDVGAKEDIYELITYLASQGKGIIFVSSELPELLRCCDRIMVLAEGQQTALLNAEETTQQEIMSYATNVLG
ncbi:sugar ABC transporter ATP-binding protein [Oceanispirochaeta crateris]|uniref:Sugar ABC transporter ATP-binding protein n=1 Tax=Oceanispirochaeta crateris TaxID=2518645 RepID=A0A5C1QNH7_9SPIO|nr:sugar ABC transporter ATP-binding protein [Oceanispirochaeta crateris]QEN09513.1 sugar ABC transporter ATP-binding protein [Oceanispirochaeta crateris]